VAPLAHNPSIMFDNAFQAGSTHETLNTLKREQLRELATLNGTLRDDEGKICSNCES